MAENLPKKNKRVRNLIVLILLVLALSCFALYGLGSGSSGSDLTTTNNRASESAEKEEVSLSFTPIRLNGHGDDVVSFEKPNVPAVIHLTHQGSSNFAVINYDSSGEKIDLLVNDIGRYDGVRPLDFGSDEWSDRLEINADGAWSAVIEPITAAEPISVPDSGHSGRGDTVLRLLGSDPDTATLSHSGESNFAVTSYGNSRRLLVNEIGKYNGTVIVPRDTVVIEVVADGSWDLAITGQ